MKNMAYIIVVMQTASLKKLEIRNLTEVGREYVGKFTLPAGKKNGEYCRVTYLCG